MPVVMLNSPALPRPVRDDPGRHQVAHPRTTGRGRRGDGSISERTKADGTIVYDTYWHYPDPITGKIKRACKRGFATRRDAARHLRTQTAAADAGSYVPPTRQRLDDYLEQWLGDLRLAPQTIAAYRTHVRRHITPRIGRITLSELTAAHLNTLYADLERNGNHTRCCTGRQPCAKATGSGPLSRTTVRHVHNTLSAALRDAVDGDRLAVSPTVRAKPPTLKQAKAQREPFHTWTADELGCFLRTWETHRFGTLWHLLAATGLRRGEALGLRWRDVDLTVGTVSIRQTVGSDKDQHGNRRTFIQPTVKSGRRT